MRTYRGVQITRSPSVYWRWTALTARAGFVHATSLYGIKQLISANI